MLSGILLVDKPAGLTSHQVLQRLKRHFGSHVKWGHTGCLDPMATGLLPVVIGRATRFADFIITLHKGYTATARLGQTTTTGDSQGDWIKEADVPDLELPFLSDCLAQFQGTFEQAYPAYSACRYEGKRFYELARAGKPIPVKTKSITILSIALLAYEAPLLSFQVGVSKGTYIRVLAEQIGEKLGCGAHLVALRRDWVGDWHVSQAQTMETLLSWDLKTLAAQLMPISGLLKEYPRFAVDKDAIDILRAGKRMQADVAPGWYQLLDEDTQSVQGLVQINAEGAIRERKWIEI